MDMSTKIFPSNPPTKKPVKDHPQAARQIGEKLIGLTIVVTGLIALASMVFWAH
jgi:hypothetical protein